MTTATLAVTDGPPSVQPARESSGMPSLAVDVVLDGDARDESLLVEIARRVTALVAELAPTAVTTAVIAAAEAGVERRTDAGTAADPVRPAAARAAAAWGAPVDAGAPAVVDPRARRVTRAGAPVPLTHKEFGLLEYLLRNADRAVARDELLREVWHRECAAEGMRTVDVHVRRLREKLGGCLQIATVRGVGYRCDLTPEIVLVGSGDAG